MATHRHRAHLIILAVVVAAACSGDAPMLDPAPPPPAETGEAQSDLTPFQQSIERTVAERVGTGLSAPKATFAYASDAGVSLSALRLRKGSPGESYTIVATTTIEYDHPNQAGLERWPAFVVDGEVPTEDGFIRPGDYTDDVKEYLAERVPGIWNTYEYGYEPRTRIVTETFTVTYPDEPEASLLADDDFVHGFTYVGPNIDYSVGDSSCTAGFCAYSVRAGFVLDWSFGIRLPMNVSVAVADAVDEGTTFSPSSTARGVDWSAADFTAAGIEPEDGNEFLMNFDFLLGMVIRIAEIEVFSLGPNRQMDEDDSFATPFGPGAVFDLPSIDAPIWGVNEDVFTFAFGLSATPQAGSNLFRANWVASSGLSGNGALAYTNPTVPRSLSSVYAVDGPSNGNIRIKDTKYVFTEFIIALGAYLDINLFGVWAPDRFLIPITDFDVSNLIPDISVPIHPGANPTTLDAGVTVRNVAPTAAINVASASAINGVDTFFAGVGEDVTFQGTSYDPGRDDLTLTWDFGNGSPTPDVSTSYPLAGATGPNDVTDTHSYAFAQACLYAVTFTSTDSDGASSQDAAAVIVRSAVETVARLAGYWQHQLKGVGNTELSAEELTCLLDIVGAVSTVFHSDRDASTVAAAFAVMDLKGNRGSESEKLDRELLLAWLNFANGAFALADLVDTDGDGAPDTPFTTALAAAEAVRLNPLATAKQLQQQRQIVHNIVAQETDEVAVSVSGAGR